MGGNIIENETYFTIGTFAASNRKIKKMLKDDMVLHKDRNYRKLLILASSFIKFWTKQPFI